METTTFEVFHNYRSELPFDVRAVKPDGTFYLVARFADVALAKTFIAAMESGANVETIRNCLVTLGELRSLQRETEGYYGFDWSWQVQDEKEKGEPS